MSVLFWPLWIGGLAVSLTIIGSVVGRQLKAMGRYYPRPFDRERGEL